MIGTVLLAAATAHFSFLQENVMSDPTRFYEPMRFDQLKGNKFIARRP
jgi:hypothetical protein